MSDLITQTDAGPAFDRFQVFDPNTDIRSGGFELDGLALQQGVIHQLNAAQFSRLQFVGAEVDFGVQTDPILVQAGNELGFSDFIRVNVNTDQILGDIAPRPQFTPTAGQTPGGPLEITFSFIDGGNQAGGTIQVPNVPPLPVYLSLIHI